MTNEICTACALKEIGQDKGVKHTCGKQTLQNNFNNHTWDIGKPNSNNIRADECSVCFLLRTVKIFKDESLNIMFYEKGIVTIPYDRMPACND